MRAVVADKTLRKIVSINENIARLLQTVIVGKIDIIKISGNRCTLSVKFEVGRLYGGLFHVSYSLCKACGDLSDTRQMAQIYAVNC